MEKINAILVDDEKSSLFALNKALEKYPDMQVIGEYKNGQKGLEAINEQKPDLIFVDIEMPIMNGFEMLDKLRYAPIVIFCTGHAKYGADAFRRNIRPADFITKPIDPKDFDTAISRALDDLNKNRQEERLFDQKESAGYIPLSTNEKGQKVIRHFLAKEILYFEGDGDWLKVHISPSSDKKDISSPFSILKKMKVAQEEYAKSGFIRIHKSFLINLFHIEKQMANEVYLKGSDIVLPVGRAFKQNLLGNSGTFCSP